MTYKLTQKRTKNRLPLVKTTIENKTQTNTCSVQNVCIDWSFTILYLCTSFFPYIVIFNYSSSLTVFGRCSCSRRSRLRLPCYTTATLDGRSRPLWRTFGRLEAVPIGSMYGIFTYIYHKNQPNVGKYTSPMDCMGLKTHDKNKKRWCQMDIPGRVQVS